MSFRPDIIFGQGIVLVDVVVLGVIFVVVDELAEILFSKGFYTSADKKVFILVWEKRVDVFVELVILITIMKKGSVMRFKDFNNFLVVIVLANAVDIWNEDDVLFIMIAAINVNFSQLINY